MSRPCSQQGEVCAQQVMKCASGQRSHKAIAALGPVTRAGSGRLLHTARVSLKGRPKALKTPQ